MSLAADDLADRIRRQIGLDPGIVEKRMFGGSAFMLHGHMIVATTRSGTLLVRVGPERYGDAVTRPGVAAMQMGGRIMTGFVEVGDDGIESEEALADWIRDAELFVATLPPK